MTDRAIVNDITAARIERAKTLVLEVVGLAEVKARRLVNKHGCQSRVILPGVLYTQDVRADRVNLYLEGGVVARAEIG